MIKTRRFTKALILILPAFLASCIRNVSGLLSSRPLDEASSENSSSASEIPSIADSIENSIESSEEEVENRDLTYWCPAVDNNVMANLVERFKASDSKYADLNIVRTANWGEGDVSWKLQQDVDSAADVMLMADDAIRGCVAKGALAPFITPDVAKYTAEAGAEAVKACSIGSGLYGLPYRADNSPMPFYDKTLFTGENAAKLGSLEGMLEVAKANSKKLYLDVANGWYNPFLLWAAGGDFGIHEEGNGTLTIATNFGNQNETTIAKRAEIAQALNAVKALYNEYRDTWIVNSDTARIEEGFHKEEIAVAFFWNDYDSIQRVASNVAVAKWPTLKVEGNDLPLSCFQSYRAVVCKNGTDEARVELAQQFARFLASEEAQRVRAIEQQAGPANLNLAMEFDETILPFYAPLSRMAAAGLAHSQVARATSDYWTPMANLGAVVVNGTNGWGTFSTADRALQNMLSSSGWNVTATLD